MDRILAYILLIGAFIAVVILLNWYSRKGYAREDKNRRIAAKARANAAKNGVLVTCPLCESTLYPGEDLFSRVYRPMKVGDQLCTINGCPHCYPTPEAGKKRICPVCHKNVPVNDGHLIARLFNKPDGKKHVIVTGCTECCKSGRKV